MDPTALVTALLAALLAATPNSPARPCVLARRPAIEAALNAARDARGVPPGVLLAVAWQESHLGCATGCGGNWGAPRDFAHRHLAGGPDEAAAVLQHGFALCHTWERAVSFFRSGSTARGCAVPARHAAYVARTVGMAARLYAAAGAPLPPAWR